MLVKSSPSSSVCIPFWQTIKYIKWKWIFFSLRSCQINKLKVSHSIDYIGFVGWNIKAKFHAGSTESFEILPVVNMISKHLFRRRRNFFLDLNKYIFTFIWADRLFSGRSLPWWTMTSFPTRDLFLIHFASFPTQVLVRCKDWYSCGLCGSEIW